MRRIPHCRPRVAGSQSTSNGVMATSVVYVRFTIRYATRTRTYYSALGTPRHRVPTMWATRSLSKTAATRRGAVTTCVRPEFWDATDDAFRSSSRS